MLSNSLGRFTLSAIGALLVSTAFVSAAVGPAHMVEARSADYATVAPQAGGAVDA